MRTLGLDPSLTAYGWAIHDSDRSGRSRRIASGHEETLPSTVPVARFMHLRSLVRDLLQGYNPDAVGIESPAYDAGPFQTIHHGLMLFSLEAIFERRKDVALFDPSTLKSLAKSDPAKKGTMTKLDMQRFVQLDTMDPNVIDNNEADAYCVAFFAARLMSVLSSELRPEDLSASERRVFVEKVRKKTRNGVTRVVKTAHAFRENVRYFRFSRVPPGSVNLPKKSGISPSILEYLESLEQS